MTTVQDLDHCIGGRLGLNVVRARIKAGAFLGCVGEALPMMSYQECLDFALYTPGVWGVGLRQPNGSNAIVAWLQGSVQL